MPRTAIAEVHYPDGDGVLRMELEKIGSGRGNAVKVEFTVAQLEGETVFDTLRRVGRDLARNRLMMDHDL